MTAAPALIPAVYEVALPWGTVLRGTSWGAGSARIICMHEPGSDIDAWGELPQTIARALPVQAVAVDLPGHGLSDDPWDERRLPDVVGCLAATNGTPVRTVIVAAGATAGVALAVAAELHLAGLVLLTVDAPGDWRRMSRSPGTAKTFFAGSLAGDDLDIARRLAASCGGWSAVTSIPSAERGTDLLRTAWGDRISEHILSFARDRVYPRPVPPASTRRKQAGGAGRR